MRSFRAFIHGPLGRIVTVAVLAASLHAFAEPSNYLTALAAERQKEAHIREIAAKMNVDPEFLLHPEGRRSFDFRALFDGVAAKLGFRSSAATADAQAQSIREQVAAVKERYALVAADTTLVKLAQLIELAGSQQTRSRKNQIKAELRSLLRLLDKDFLPAAKENLSGTAKARERDMREAIKNLRRDIKKILDDPHAFDDGNVDATLVKLRDTANGRLKLRNRGPRWTRDPFPLKDTYRFAPIVPAGPSYDGQTTTAATALEAKVSSTSNKPAMRVASNAVASEVTALAATLGTPAKAFTWVHDRVEWDSYSGVAKGAFGAMKEARGNDWDQALLLRDLLIAQGYDAQLEWGRVTLPIEKAMNLVGTEDPLQAANLLATAGFDGMLLTSKGAPVAVQMTHAWVRAFIPYIPNRGATAGTPDTWVRMDPSFKRYDYQPGIAINGKVTWDQDEYLNAAAATLQQPSQFYGDKIWSYIRASKLDCQNLSQVAKLGRVRAANFPFVPSTLTTKIDEVRGLAASAPADQVQSVGVAIVSETGATVATFSSAIADLWGKKLSLTFAPATADDAATIASYGGLFETPAYLIRLKPVFSLDDQAVAEGSPIAAGAALDMNLTFHQPNVPDDFTHHEVVAGETHALVLDPGVFPDSLVQSRIERLQALTAANASEDAIRSEQLYLVGLRYMQHVDDGIAFATGVRWQRGVKRVFEANVRRQIDITYNIAGAPVRLKPAENNIDVSRLLVGIVPINNDLSNRAEALALAGLQSSYLEGAIWEEMQSQQGISAAKALLLARQAGQQLHTVTQSNVDAILAAVSLDAVVESEVRGAVAQGRIAKIASANVSLGRWSGTGYILQDPRTGAATYPISGGLAGGSTTGELIQSVREMLGSELWLQGSPLGELIAQLLTALSGGEGSNDAPSTTQSDPVNLSSGNMHRTLVDLSIVARGIPVTVVRTYNSRSTYKGPLGYGWTFNYGEVLIPNSDGSVTYRESDGSEHIFAHNGGSYVTPQGKYLQLVLSGSGWTLTEKNGFAKTFDAQGLLITQIDLNGNHVTVQRDANGLPSTVVDAAGRPVLTFTTTGGHITRVTDLAGRTVDYAYDGDDLIAVTDASGKVWPMTYDLKHNMTSLADPIGNTQFYDYDTEDRLLRHVDANGGEETFQYDLAGRRSVITDRRGGDRFVQFDDDGRATLEADPAGNIIQASFDDDNNRTAVVNSRGDSTTFEYDQNGNVTRQVNPDGGVITATYDAYSRPLTTTDAAGTMTTNTYDSSGNLLTSSRTVGGVTQTTTNTYDLHGQLLTMKDANGATSSMTWNANGTIATETDEMSNTTTVISDDLGRITSFKDPAGNETKFTYDGRDRLRTMTDPHNVTTSLTYDDAGRRTDVTTPRGTIHCTYDAEGRVVSMVDPLGHGMTTTYNLAGDVIARTDGRGNTTRYEYDSVGRVTKMVDAAGGVWTYGYCASLGGGSCSSCGGSGTGFCELTDPNGYVIKQEFDKMGRVTSVTDATSKVARTSYDKLGRKNAETDANGNVTRYGYDEAGHLTSVTEANDAVTHYTYDANGNKLTQTDANGHVWSFKYDALNRLIEEVDPLRRKTAYTYDVLGNLKTKTDAKGQTLTYTYDIRQLTRIDYPDGSADTYTYDPLGRRLTSSNANVTMAYTYDALNRITSVTNQRYNLVAHYEYDASGNRTKLITPQSTVTYAYDAKNRLTQMSDTLFGVFRFAYDAVDRRRELEYPNKVKTNYDYDEAHRLIAIVTKDAASTLLDAWSYQYDAVGNRTSKTYMNGKTESYVYDNVYRLTDAHYGDGTYEKFTYDPAGNRLTRTDESGTILMHSYDVANQLTKVGSEARTYDLNGNLTSIGTNRTFTYDYNNRPTHLSTFSGTESNQYDADGRRVNMTGTSIEGAQVRVFYDLIGNPILDWSTSNNTWTYRLYGPGIDEPLAEWRYVNNRTTYLHRDALGSITAVTNTSGKLMYSSTYKAFGEMSRTSYDAPTTRLGYTGREMSVGGLMQYRGRYYEPGAGRFLQQDLYRGSAAAPPSLHRYVYVHNNAVNFIDPSGHYRMSATEAFFAAADLSLRLTTFFALLGTAASHYYTLPIVTVIAWTLVAIAVAIKAAATVGAFIRSFDPSAPTGSQLGIFAPLYFAVWTASFVGLTIYVDSAVERLAKKNSPHAYAMLAILFYVSAVTLVMSGIDVVGWYFGIGPEEDPANEAILKEFIGMEAHG